MVVWKFTLSVGTGQKIEMPRFARILHVAAQGHDLCLWAHVDPTQPTEQRTFYVFGTGHDMGPQYNEQGDSMSHVGTALMNSGTLVLHVFELEDIPF